MDIPPASSNAALARMRRQRRTDTKPELAIRRLLHAQGFRYRVDVPVLPGLRRRADLAFPGSAVVVFVDGCFWHSCPVHATQPRQNGDWWAAKLATNVARDRDTDERLRAAGWTVVRVWEHEPPDAAAAHIASRVRAAAESVRRGHPRLLPPSVRRRP
jgi:DNA mismatch endonuclease (patch repair protein)